MTTLYYLIPAAVLLAVWACYGHREAARLRDVLDAPASPLDAAMERIVTPPPVRSAALAVAACAEHAPVHPLARPNGRDLADRLRTECPWLTDAHGAEVCATLIVYAAQQADRARSPWLVFTDALTFAVVEFAALERETERTEP